MRLGDARWACRVCEKAESSGSELPRAIGPQRWRATVFRCNKIAALTERKGRYHARVVSLTAEWKYLSNKYSEARERFEAASSAVAARRMAYATPTEKELVEHRAARIALQTATRRLYDFLARSEIADHTT